MGEQRQRRRVIKKMIEFFLQQYFSIDVEPMKGPSVRVSWGGQVTNVL